MSSPLTQPVMATSTTPAPAALTTPPPVLTTDTATSSTSTSAPGSPPPSTPSAIAAPSTPMTAMQKRRAARALAEANSPSPSPSRPVMECTYDPAKFTLVTIHTAKCSSCDKRLQNKEIMKRCPGCGWQVCENCAKTKIEQSNDFKHGNASTPSPRKLVIRKPLYALGTPGASTSPGPSGGSALKMELGILSPSTNTEVKVEVPSATPGVTPTKRARAKPAPKPKTPKSKGKGKKKQIDSDDSDDLDNDGDFTAGASASKRQKTQQPAPLKDSPPGVLGVLGERRSARVIPPKPPGNPATSSLAAGPANKKKPSVSRQAPTQATTLAMMKPKPMVKLLPAKKPNRTMEYVRNTFPGLDVLERYKSRIASGAFDRADPMKLEVVLEKNFESDHGRRPTAEELQALIYEKVKHKLWGPNGIAGKGSNGPGSDSEQQDAKESVMKMIQEEVDTMPVDGLNPEGIVMTARQYVNAGYENLIRGIALDDDQQNTLKQSMAEAARKYATKFYSEQPVTMQQVIGKGLDLKLNALPAAKLPEFKEVVASEAYRCLNEFAEEAGNTGAVPEVATSRSGVGEMLVHSESVDVDRRSLHTDTDISVRGDAAGAQDSEKAVSEHSPRSAL